MLYAPVCLYRNFSQNSIKLPFCVTFATAHRKSLLVIVSMSAASSPPLTERSGREVTNSLSVHQYNGVAKNQVMSGEHTTTNWVLPMKFQQQLCVGVEFAERKTDRK